GVRSGHQARPLRSSSDLGGLAYFRDTTERSRPPPPARKNGDTGATLPSLCVRRLTTFLPPRRPHPHAHPLLFCRVAGFSATPPGCAARGQEPLAWQSARQSPMLRGYTQLCGPAPYHCGGVEETTDELASACRHPRREGDV